jgi:hypothetical protein
VYKRSTLIGSIVAVLIALGGCAGTATIDTTGEPTHDGLYPVKSTTMKKVWGLPGADFSGYTKLGLQSLGIHYRPVKDRNSRRPMSGSSTEFPIDEKTRDRLQELTRDVFIEELQKIEGFEFVDASEDDDPDVLFVRAGLLDVVSRVPPDPIAGRSDIYLNDVGQATFVVELIDAESGTVLARAVDTRAAGDNTVPIRSNTATNTAETRRLIRQWATLLRSALEELVQHVGVVPTK